MFPTFTSQRRRENSLTPMQIGDEQTEDRVHKEWARSRGQGQVGGNTHEGDTDRLRRRRRIGDELVKGHARS